MYVLWDAYINIIVNIFYVKRDIKRDVSMNEKKRRIKFYEL